MARVLLVSADEEIGERFRSTATALNSQFVQVTSEVEPGSLGATALLTDQPDVVVFEVGDRAELVREWTEILDREHPDITVIWVAEAEADSWKSALRAGARDLINPAATTHEIFESLSRAIDINVTRSASNLFGETPEPEGPRNRVITVISPKGGSGKTMLSTNLAYGLRQESGEEVVIVDLDLQFGDVSSSLRLRPEYSVLHAISAVGDPTAVKTFLTPHPSGLYALAAPSSPAEADDVSAEGLGKLLDLLRNEFPYVVLDTGAGLDETTLTAVEFATDVLFVTTTDLAAVESLRKAVLVLNQLGIMEHRRWYVLNRANARVGLSQEDIERSTGLTVDASLPSSRSVPIAMNQGSPVLEDDPRGAFARSLNAAVDLFLPDYSAGRHAAPAKSSWFKRIAT